MQNHTKSNDNIYKTLYKQTTYATKQINKHEKKAGPNAKSHTANQHNHDLSNAAHQKQKCTDAKSPKIQPKTQPNNGEKSNDTTGPKQTHKQSSNIAAHQKRTHIELSNQHAQHHHTNNVTDKRTDHKTNSQHLQTTHEQMNFAKTQQINTTTISAMLHIKKNKNVQMQNHKKIQP